MRSLQEFQLGDGGGPAALIAWNAGKHLSQSPEFQEIVDLWFAEEKEHSRLLGGLLKRFGAESLDTHWSFRLFCLLRRWLGYHFELQAPTLTELTSSAYYAILQRRCPDVAVKDVWPSST